MPLPYTFATAAAGNNPAQHLDANFSAVAALGVIGCTATGTNSIVLTTAANTPTLTALSNYLLFSFTAAATSTNSVSVQINALTAVPLYLAGTTGTQAGAGDVVQNVWYLIAYNGSLNSGSGGFVIVNAITSSGIFTKSFTSTAQTLSYGSLLTLPHSLGVAPTLIQAIAKCVISQGNWSTGDEFLLNPGPIYDVNDGVTAAQRGFAIYWDATNLYVRVPANAMIGSNKTTAAPFSMTAADWNLIFKAWA